MDWIRMPWLNKIEYDERHICKLPNVQEAGVGSTWECPDCRSVYKIVQKFFGDKRRWRGIARPVGTGAPQTYVPPPTPPGRNPVEMPWDGLPGIRAAGGKTTELSSDETPKPPVGPSPSGVKPPPPYVRIGRAVDDDEHPVFGAITMHEKRTAELMDEEVHRIITEREFLGYTPIEAPVYLKD